MSYSLSVSGLLVTSPRERTLLQVDAFEVARGSLIGVRGPSGAGKSTLLFALAGLLERAKGKIRWGAFDILAAKPAARADFRAARIGMIFQDFLLFDELDAAANASVAGLFSRKAARAGIASSAQKTLERLNVPTNSRNVASFSGGERQRVAVARALATDPDILLADEPTASLDRAAADGLTDDLIRLARAGSKILIVVSHDPVLLAQMDRILTIKDGVIADDEQVQ